MLQQQQNQGRRFGTCTSKLQVRPLSKAVVLLLLIRYFLLHIESCYIDNSAEIESFNVDNLYINRNVLCYTSVYIESFHLSQLYIVSIEILKNLNLWRESSCWHIYTQKNN